MAQGELLPDAQVLVANAEDVPLVVRRTYGLGTVDYLTPDPLAQPLRDWDGLGSLWFNLAITTDPHPAWAHGTVDFDLPAIALAITGGALALINMSIDQVSNPKLKTGPHLKVWKRLQKEADKRRGLA